VWDSEGKKILDAMSGLWCVNAGYGRKELADAAYQQMMTLPFYNSFFQTTNVPAVQLAAKLAGRWRPTWAGAVPARVLQQQRQRKQRHQRAHGAPLLGPDGPAAAQGHHQPPQRLPRLTMAGASLGGMSGMHAQGDLPIPNITHIEQPYW
jgi:putrescine---pyruvate transaminase